MKANEDFRVQQHSFHEINGNFTTEILLQIAKKC